MDYWGILVELEKILIFRYEFLEKIIILVIF